MVSKMAVKCMFKTFALKLNCLLLPSYVKVILLHRTYAMYVPCVGTFCHGVYGL
jgi:hypothetical protein